MLSILCYHQARPISINNAKVVADPVDNLH